MPVNPCTLSQVRPEQIDAAATPERVAKYWGYLKENYVHKGVPYPDAMRDMAKKFDVPEQFLARLMTKPKSLRKLSEEARKNAKLRSQFLKENEMYVRNLDTPGVAKILKLLWEAPRSTLLAAHGPVIPITHGGDYIVRLDTLPRQVRTWMEAVATAKEGVHEGLLKTIDEHPRSPEYAGYGLRIKPEDTLAHNILKELWPNRFRGKGHLSWANKANTAVKLRRLREMDRWMKNAPADPAGRAEFGKLAAESINHATGGISPHEAGLGMLGQATIAPALTASKWIKTYVDPAKTAYMGLKMLEGKATPAERRILGIRARNAGLYLGSLFGLLAVNKGLTEWGNSKQHVNLDDPSKADLWRFKVGGYVINPRGSQEVLQLTARLLYAAKNAGYQKGKKGKGTSPEELLGRYGSYKMHPGIGLGREMFSQKDIFGRPVPWSKEKGTKYKPKLEVPEYIAEKGPIFIGGAVHEIYDGMREAGMDTGDIRNVLRALSNPKIAARGAITGFGEFLGLGIYKEHQK